MVVHGRYEGPRGDGWTTATFVHDGGRRWRIEGADTLLLDDGETAVVVRTGGVSAVDSDPVDPATFRWSSAIDEDLRAASQ
jgi:hypothetical protein